MYGTGFTDGNIDTIRGGKGNDTINPQSIVFDENGILDFGASDLGS